MRADADGGATVAYLQFFAGALRNVYASRGGGREGLVAFFVSHVRDDEEARERERERGAVGRDDGNELLRR